jgi:Cu/Ag efflux pump CusA
LNRKGRDIALQIVVEARITTPIEIEMIGIPYKRILRSVTKYALTDVTIECQDGVDVYWARNLEYRSHEPTPPSHLAGRR